MTLLEVIIATTLLVMLFSVVFAYVFGAFRTREVIEQRGVPWSIGPVVMQRLADDLRFAEFESIAENVDGFKAEAAREDEAKLDFVTSVPSRDRVSVRDEWVRAAVNEVGYRLRRSETDSSLYALYRREDLGVDGDPAEGGKYYKLCDRVRSFRIDWFDKDPGEPQGDDAQGATDWDGSKEKKLPWGCRIRLVLATDAATDDRGAETEQSKDLAFVTYVAFRSRFDKAEGAKAPNQPGR